MITVLTQRALKFAAITLIRQRNRFLGEKLPKPDIYYFAYGANLDPDRFKKYQANVEPLGVARLDGYSLKFTMPCEYVGKGYASAEKEETNTVWGYLYKIDRPTLFLLDVSEYAFLRHYERKLVKITPNKGHAVDAWIYKTPFSTPGLMPSDQYKQLIVKAAIKIELPERYWRLIESEPSKSKFDLDPGYSLTMPSIRRPFERFLHIPYLLHDRIREIVCEKLRF